MDTSSVLSIQTILLINKVPHLMECLRIRGLGMTNSSKASKEFGTHTMGIHQVVASHNRLLADFEWLKLIKLLPIMAMLLTVYYSTKASLAIQK